MWRGGDNDDVAGSVVWRKVKSLIDMCRAADRIMFLNMCSGTTERGVGC